MGGSTGLVGFAERNRKQGIGGIKGWDICPSINQGRIRARRSIGNLGDPGASISRGVPQAPTAGVAAAPPLRPRSLTIAGYHSPPLRRSRVCCFPDFLFLAIELDSIVALGFLKRWWSLIELRFFCFVWLLIFFFFFFLQF